MKTFCFIAMLTVLTLSSKAQQSQPSSTSTAATDAAVKPPLHPATVDQIREYLSLLGVEKATQELMNSGLKAMQTTAAPYYPASFFTDLADGFRHLDVTAIDVPIYQKYVSQDEMAAAISFYRSPVGHRFIELQPMLTNEAKVLMRAKGAEIGAAVYAKHKDEIEAAKKQYQAQKGTGSDEKIPR